MSKAHPNSTPDWHTSNRVVPALWFFAALASGGCLSKGDTTVNAAPLGTDAGSSGGPADADSPDTGPACTVGEGDSAVVQQLAAGSIHTCARMSDGTVRCWTASNIVGQLGTGTTDESLVPIPVPGLTGVVDLDAGGLTTCAVDCAGAVWCWGGGRWGELGNGTADVSLVPVRVPGLENATRVFAGDSNVCALTGADKSLYCWGSNGLGTVGNGSRSGESCASGSESCVLRPTLVKGELWDTIEVALGGVHACAVSGTGSTSCWGNNGWGQLALDDVSEALVATMVTGGGGFEHIAAGNTHVCGTWSPEDGGLVLCWGANMGGQLGRGSITEEGDSAYLQATGVEDVQQLVAGDVHTCALRVDGAVYCWGDNSLGQLGTGALDGEPWAGGDHAIATPTRVVNLSGARSLSAGSNHTCALVSDGDVYCWGENTSGQLGDGTTRGEACGGGGPRCRPSPVRVVF